MRPYTRTSVGVFVLCFGLALLALPAYGQDVFINEIHYDNVGGDTGEFVEIAGPAGTDLSGWEIELYNGANGTSYGSSIILSGTIDDEGNGFGALSFPQAPIQNGAPDGLALVAPGPAVVQFLSYEGSFVAVGGPADGMTSTDIGVSEPGAIGESLQLTGTGVDYGDFMWSGPSAESPGSVNAGQSFVAPSFLELQLVAEPVGGSFDLFIDGAIIVTGGSGITTGEQTVPAGDRSVRIGGDGKTNSNDYTTTFSCRDTDGTGDLVVEETVTGTTPATVPVGEGEDVVCIVTARLQGSIEGLISNDLDGDGVREAGEPGIADVTVFLDLNANSNRDVDEPTTTSFSNGFYRFLDLVAGTYPVTVDEATVPDGFTLTTGNNPIVVNLAAGEEFATANFGYFATVAVTFAVDGSLLGLDRDGNAPDEVLALRGNLAPLSFDASFPLADDDGDGIWTGTVFFDANLAGQTLEYKFVRHLDTQYDISAAMLGDPSFEPGGFEGNVGPGDSGNRVLEIPDEDTVLPVVFFNNEAPMCDGVPRITSQVLDTDANTVTVTFEDGDGLTEIDFTLLNNLVVTGFDGFSSTNGATFTPTGMAPETAVFVVEQADPSIPEGSFYVNITDGCTPVPEVYFADPILRMGADAAVPAEFGLSAAYPNPFGGSAARTVIPVDVAEASEVRVVIYDVLGRSVATLLDGALEAGRYEVVLDSAGLPAGTYLVRMTATGATAGAFRQTQRLTLLR